MSRTIVIDPVTRIEGHSKITIQLDARGEVTDAHFHVTQFRGFERITQGRPVHEMPALMARICGICPVSHLVASAKAVDDIMAVEPTPTGADLRRVINLGQIVQSNALSFFHLSSPDLLFGFDADPSVRNIVGVARHNPQLGSGTSSAWRAEPELAKDGIELRKWGQQIIEWVAGKRIHPEGIVPGGVAWPLTAEVRDRILAGVPEAIAAVERAIAWYKTDMMRWEEEAATFGNFRSAFMGLVDRNGNVDHYGGWLRVIDADGKFLADKIDPKLVQRLHRRGRRALVVPQVDLLEGDGLPGRHLPGGPAGPAQRGRADRHARAPTRSSRSSAGASAGWPARRSTTTTRA